MSVTQRLRHHEGGQVVAAGLVRIRGDFKLDRKSTSPIAITAVCSTNSSCFPPTCSSDCGAGVLQGSASDKCHKMSTDVRLTLKNGKPGSSYSAFVLLINILTSPVVRDFSKLNFQPLPVSICSSSFSVLSNTPTKLLTRKLKRQKALVNFP